MEDGRREGGRVGRRQPSAYLFKLVLYPKDISHHLQPSLKVSTASTK